MPSRPEPAVVVLDSEALAALSFPRERTRAARRAQAVLTAIERLGGRARVPAPVIAEVARTAARRAAVDRVLSRVPVTTTDRQVATRAGEMLGKLGLDSCHAVDALVAATAIAARPSVVITGDPDDLSRLVGAERGVGIQELP